MNRTESPKKPAVPFATNGDREDLLSTTPAGDNHASYDKGFPPVTMLLKGAGGLPPRGQDMNQILFELASVARWAGAGAGYSFDADFATTVGGYPVGAKVLSTDGAGYWVNTSESNSSNPEVTNGSLTGWVPAGFYGVTSITGLTSTNVTLTSLQAARDRIELSGTLTANINIVVPAWRKTWAVVNNTTGAFTVTIKTPSGTGVSVASGKKVNVYGDSVNITDTGYLQTANNLSEIAAAGSVAQSTALTNLGVKRQRTYVSAGQTLVANTPTIVTHGLTIDPTECILNIRLKCLTANNGYSVGDYAVAFAPRITAGSTAAMTGSLAAVLTSTTVQFNTGDSGISIMPKASGLAVGINTTGTLAQWALEFVIFY